jgi:pimeloyl-ACP methyl ester carboxylesterase/CHAT domain-containing protein
MTTISSGTTTVAGVRIRGEHLGGEVDMGLPVERGGGRPDLALDAALRRVGERTDGDATLVVRAELTVHPVLPSSEPSRGGEPAREKDQEPRLVIDGPPLADGEVAQIAVVEEDGLLRFVLPVAGTSNQFEIALGDSLASERGPERGITFKAAALAIRVIGVLGGRKAVNAGFRSAVRLIEDKARPRGLRTFLSDSFRDKPDGRSAITFSSGPSALLLLHGVHSSSHSCFRLPTDVVKLLERRYDGRVLAFDHPTLGYSPRENAAELAERLASFRLDNVDILAHSRGGLVARELVADAPDGVNIRSIVHVATPNGGTPLADGEYLGQFLSVATNLIGFIPDNPVTDVIGIVLDVLREWVLQPVGELPGIAAMKPDSTERTELNGGSQPRLVQRAVASSFEPGPNHGALLRLRDLVTDRAFLGVDNDLLVPTRSTYRRSGQFHIPVGHRLVLDTSFAVSHSQFWTEPQVTSVLERWLDPAAGIDEVDEVPAKLTDPAAELDEAMATGDVDSLRRAIGVLGHDKLGLVAELVGGPLPSRTRGSAPTSKQGTVVVLPGVMGSRLTTTENGREVWFSPWHLLRGRFTDLRLDGERPMKVEVTGLVRQYAPLVAQLDRSWDVLPFPYDWRRPIAESAQELAARLESLGIDIGGDRPVHFVGHSMGGLVARAFLVQHHADWARGCGRFVQLGTPNWGSFAMPLAVWGEERLVRALALADAFHDEEKILDTIASFPGVLELFPSPARLLPGSSDAEHSLLYQAATWPKRTSAAFASGLTAALTFHETSKTAWVDRMVYVAGDNQTTPYRVRMEADKSLSFGVTKRGDGRVPHYFGHEGLDREGREKLKVFYAGSEHGALVSDRDVLAALDGLLETGTTTLLPDSPGTARGSGTPEPEVWIKASELERGFAGSDRGDGRNVDLDRGARLLRASEIYLGSTGESRGALPPVHVRIVHGSLEQARHPVAAGRYKGIPIDGALGYIDERFGGALTELYEAGLYPDDAGTARYLRAPENVYPLGVILLGLGEFGSLTPDLLARAVERGTSDYALAAKRQSPGLLSVGISAVLVGTPGRYGLTIVTSILATIRGVARASANLHDKVTISELEIIELSEARALEAAIALERLDDSAELTTMEAPIVIDTTIQARPGGRPGSHGYEESGAPWPRLMLEFADHHDEDDNLADPPTDAVRKLKYVSLGRRAQASNLEVDVVLSQIDRHVRTAIQDPHADPQTNNTLFELLLPNEAKLELETLDNLHLLVDESTAWIPWEMITGRDTTGRSSRPLALRAGLLRQLKSRSPDAPRKILRAVTDHALVIGDPPSDLPRLPGAVQEARLVADELGKAGFEVNDECIFGDGAQPSAAQAAGVLDEFFRQHYRVIHVAAHGRFDAKSRNPLQNGVVISAAEVLGPVQFRQRLVAPDLVFLNCCHIGRIDSEAGAPEDRSHYAHLAASLALELLRSGVAAVVAAGWAVNDRQAATFAGTFYRAMLAGETFGEAVKEARGKAFDDGQTNTWAAYQCYGDPDFQLRTDRRQAQRRHTIYSPRHLINELKAVEKQAGDAVDSEHVTEVVEHIHALQREGESRFTRDVEVWLALAQAYAEAGAFERALLAYRRAIPDDTSSDRGVQTLDAYRQYANIEARFAAQKARGEEGPLPFDQGEDRITDEPSTLFARAESRLDDLSKLDTSPEWFAIRGSLHKKRASTLDAEDPLRARELQRSMAAYRSAVQRGTSDRLNVYHGSLTLLMAYALDWPRGTKSLRAEYLARWDDEKDLRSRDSGDYWERAELADINATTIVTAGELTQDARRATLVEEFIRAFRVRSTLRNRSSVIDNYRDLGRLLHAEDGEAAIKVADELAAFRPPRLTRRAPAK